MDKEDIYCGKELLSPGQEFWDFLWNSSAYYLGGQNIVGTMKNVPHMKQCKSISGLTRAGFVAQWL